MNHLQDDLREIELIGWHTRDCTRSGQTYEHTQTRNDGEHHATRPKRGEARKIRAREARNPEHHQPELERLKAKAKAERKAAKEANKPERLARAEETAVLRRTAAGDIWDKPETDTYTPELVVAKNLSYQHEPLQPATHLWADLVTASSADQRKGNTRKGG